jgi:hypothetical protein
MSFLLELPFILSFLLVCAVSVTAANLGLAVVRKYTDIDILKEHHDVAAIIFNAFGILYAVVVAFVVFVTWSHYDDANKNIQFESSEAIDIFQNAGAFPDAARDSIRKALLDYTTTLYNDDWIAMAKGSTSNKSYDAIRRLMNIYLTIDLKTMNNVSVYEESFKRLNDLAQYRRLRNFSAGDSVPNVIWVLLLVGAFIMITYTYFFGVKRALPQYLMTSALSITLTLILYLIFTLDHPFAGSNSISNEPVKRVMNIMQRVIDNQNKKQQNQQNPNP